MVKLDTMMPPIEHRLGLENIQPLPFTLDHSCPVALSHKPVTGTLWPSTHCGPATSAIEKPAELLKRRCLETLFLPEIIMPLRDLQADIARVSPTTLPSAIEPLLLSLKQIERRHRTILRDLISAIQSGMSSTSLPEVKTALLDEAVDKSGLAREEVDMVKVSIEMRSGCRRATEAGTGIEVKLLTGELEKREALIQALLLFHYIPSYVPNRHEKKRKKSKNRVTSESSESSPIEDPSAVLATLMDRLSIWSALSDMALDPPLKEGDGWTQTLKLFWCEIIAPTFIPSQVELCATFHQKVFAAPLPSSYLPPPVVPVRPSVPSRDQISRTSSLSVRSASRAPSEASDQSHSNNPAAGSLHRSRSRTSETLGTGQETRRSRSKSIDPGTTVIAKPPDVPKRPLIRAPSGKDLFKGREIGLMRRTASKKSQEGLGVGSGKREEGHSLGLGLLGRKTSDPKKRKVSNEGHFQTQSESGTIVFATPAKPRYGNPFSHRGDMGHPTPIREESSSAERIRPAFIAETPSANRISGTPSTLASRVAETPRSGGPDRLSFHGDEDDEDEDDLGDLMVMTDEEGDETETDTSSPAAPARGLVPETPNR